MVVFDLSGQLILNLKPLRYRGQTLNAANAEFIASGRGGLTPDFAWVSNDDSADEKKPRQLLDGVFLYYE